MSDRAPSKPSDFSLGRVQQYLVSFCAAGGTPDDLPPLIQDHTLMQRVIAYARRGGYEATTSQKRAREIMGKNFLGIEEATEHFKIKFSDGDIKALAEIPYPENVLLALKNTHVLVAGYPLNVLEIRARAPGIFHVYIPDWYNDRQEKFAREKCPLAWLFIRKGAVPSSAGRAYNDQLALLSPEEENPLTAEVVYMVTLYFLIHKVMLFRNVWVRTASQSSDGYRVFVVFYDGRLRIYGWHDNSYDGIGLASSRKFQK